MFTNNFNEETFIPPPECPVYEPTDEEWEDPLAYIDKIRPVAEKSGIIKIRPPPHWQPPFAIPVDDFKFTPRVQRINELGVRNRLQKQFCEKVNKFWQLQGIPFKHPFVGGKFLDLYQIHEAVKTLGGYQEVCKAKLWTKIATELKLQKSFSGALHKHYEKILFPLDAMLSGLTVEALESLEKRHAIASIFKSSNKRKPSMYKGSSADFDLDILSLSSRGITPRKKRGPVEEPLFGDVKNNKELAKLQIFGAAGTKFVGLGVRAQETIQPATSSTATKEEVMTTEEAVSSESPKKYEDLVKEEVITQENQMEDLTEEQKTVELPSDDIKEELDKVQTRHRGKDQTPYSMIDSMDNCKMCGKDTDTDLLMCESCDDNYHMNCLIIPLSQRPSGDWRCPKCVLKELSKKPQCYGFGSASKEYNLHTFGEMADAFKKDYFKRATHCVETEEVEIEFWRLVGSLQDDLSVEYGADIQVTEKGSGFPRLTDENITKEDECYAKCGWNLNNLPMLKNSFLRNIKGEISGMKVPWVYVGMCFSAFCWHTEDHWTYSINYMHWGEPKTWYGVPREDAGKFEAVMKASAPELFKSHPDLLHHLVTTMNPTILMKHGVRVVRTNQCAGEFMVTFPRAYHAGFNQGYNFAEAVNFCPPDWLPLGKDCIEHYRKMRKTCVFSHEEVICLLSQLKEQELDGRLAGHVYKEMFKMVEEEESLRKSIEHLKLEQLEVAFECVPDDLRQCASCNTTVYLSAVECQCDNENKISTEQGTKKINLNRCVCLRHIDDLCDKCPESSFLFKYRYTLEHLKGMLDSIKNRAAVFDQWVLKVDQILDKEAGLSAKKCTLKELELLINQAEHKNFPTSNEKLSQLQRLQTEADVCTKVSETLIRSWNSELNESQSDSLTACFLQYDEIIGFQQQIKNLPCSIKLEKEVTMYIDRIKRFVENVELVLAEKEPNCEVISDLLKKSHEFQISLTQVPKLKQALQQAEWLKKVRTKLGASLYSDGRKELNKQFAKPEIKIHELTQMLCSGKDVKPHDSISYTIRELQRLVSVSEGFERQCEKIRNGSLSCPVEVANGWLKKIKTLPVILPNYDFMCKQVKMWKEWQKKRKTVTDSVLFPYVDQLEELIRDSKDILLELNEVKRFEGYIDRAKKWIQDTEKVFIKKGTDLTLLQILTPRDANDIQNVWIKRKKSNDNSGTSNLKLRYFDAERSEMTGMKEFRESNDEKTSSAGAHRSSSDESNQKEKVQEKNELEKTIYCLCRKAYGGDDMIQCELCHEWYHNRCVNNLPRFHRGKNKIGHTVNKQQSVFEYHFLCPLCQRSRRPDIAEVLRLLLELQKLPVRIPEGEALQFLCERAVRWQTKTRTLLDSSECKIIIDSVLAVSNNSVKKEVDIEVTIPNLNTSQPPPLQSNNFLSTTSRTSIDDAIDAVVIKSGVTSHVKLESVPPCGKSDDKRAEVAMVLATLSENITTTNDELPQRNNSPDLACYEKIDNTTPTKNEETESKTVEIKEEPLDILLTDQTKYKLEDLMFEGDLIEISLAETQLVWKILCKAHEATNKPEVDDASETSDVDGVNNSKVVKSPIRQLPVQNASVAHVVTMSGDMSAANKRKKKEMTSPIETKRKKKNSKPVISQTKLYQNLDSPMEITKEKAEKKRKKREENQALINQARAVSVNGIHINHIDDDGDDSDDNALCSLKINGKVACRLPIGDDINWVLCDACNEWFHCSCVNISPEKAKNIHVYICDVCTKL